MTAAQAVILIGGFLVLLSGMIALMIRVIKREKQSMQRPQEEWIARGSIPEEKPNFYSSSNKSAQEAHEAIRPTDANFTPHDAHAKLSTVGLG